jgi:hypothetical protein
MYMPANELRIGNRAAYLRKAIRTPNFDSDSVLTRDAFQFAELWLKRNCKDALPFWRQAATYAYASKSLPPLAAPLTSYYCFLNAVKALLTVKKVDFSERHGVSGTHDPTAKRALSNEVIKLQNAGIMSALSRYLEEPENNTEHTLTHLLASLPFIHRAYRHTYKSQRELFIPIRNVVYRKHPTDNYIWFSAEINGRYADARSLRTLPDTFEVDNGYTDKCVIRTKRRIKWHSRGSDNEDQEMAISRLNNLHKVVRLDLSFISAPIDLWYIRREISGTPSIKRYGITMIMAIMHRLSELSRYDPKGLSSYQLFNLL